MLNINGHPIEACICVHDIPTFITTNAVAIAGVALAGKTYVISAITSMVSAGPRGYRSVCLPCTLRSKPMVRSATTPITQ